MSEIEILSAIHGIAPRSDELLRLGTGLDHQRVSQSSFDQLVAEETEAWLDLQAAAGIDLAENGKLKWLDHLRPIVKASSGFAPGIDDAPLTRWFHDNRFYHRPTIEDRLKLDFDLAADEIGPLGDNISLLSPQSFAGLCVDNFPDLPAERNVVQLYADLFFFFEQQGVKRILLEDYHRPAAQDDSDLIDVRCLANWYPTISLSIIRPNGQLAVPYHVGTKFGVAVEEPLLEIICNLPIHRRPDLSGAEVWHQVINVADTTEDDLDSHGFPLKNFQLLAPARLILTNNVDLECLPLSAAKEKVKRLGEFTASLSQIVWEQL